jgi:hypothetical protein
MKSPIHISIAFGDAILPVAECDDGFKRVPLKPIVEQVGASWKGQYRRVQSGYLNQRLGICGVVFYTGAGRREMTAIRLDRVTAYLNSLNPDQIRSAGNNDAADWLEAKHSEWDDALHHYETDGFAIKESQDARQLINTLSQIDRIKDTTIKRIAAEKANAAFGIEIPIGNQKAMDV